MVATRSNIPDMTSPATLVNAARSLVVLARRSDAPPDGNTYGRLSEITPTLIDCLRSHGLYYRITLTVQYNATVCDYNQILFNRPQQPRPLLELIPFPTDEVDAMIRNLPFRDGSTVLADGSNPSSIAKAIMDILARPFVWQCRLSLFRKEILQSLLQAYRQTEDHWTNPQKHFFKESMTKLCVAHNESLYAFQPVELRDRLEINELLSGAGFHDDSTKQEPLAEKRVLVTSPPIASKAAKKKECDLCGRIFDPRGLPVHKKTCTGPSKAEIARRKAAAESAVAAQRGNGAREVDKETLEAAETLLMLAASTPRE